jgi:DNA-binding transcriptional MerR regulator
MVSDVEGPTWKVGQLARLTKLTVRTLHHYDRLGLLRPSARTSSGHRLYDEGDVDRLYRIVALRELNLPLEVSAIS